MKKRSAGRGLPARQVIADASRRLIDDGDLGGDSDGDIDMAAVMAEERADEVVLVADDGTPIGTHDRLSVHTATTPLHLAFSVHLRDESGAVLITRRALSKLTWPGVWTNSCCGHLLPDETALQAVARRAPQELGATVRDLQPVLPDFRYRAVDASGIVENEICPVFIGTVTRADVRPDPGEVEELAWVDWSEVVRTAQTLPHLLSPWSVQQWSRLGAADPWASL